MKGTLEDDTEIPWGDETWGRRKGNGDNETGEDPMRQRRYENAPPAADKERPRGAKSVAPFQ